MSIYHYLPAAPAAGPDCPVIAVLQREKRMKVVEEKLAAALAEARLLGVGLDDLTEMLQLLYQEER
jgi:hypothetical protein